MMFVWRRLRIRAAVSRSFRTVIVARGAASLCLSFALAACAVGPDYVRPDAPTPVVYKEYRGWKRATPRDDAIKGDWWSVFRDPLLSSLERQVVVSNQTLKQSEANYRQALAIIREASSGLFPIIQASYSASRGTSGGGFSSGATGGGGGGGVANTFTLEATGSWDLDVWGRIRRTVESDAASAQASAADLANATLSAQAQLASAYYNLRATDALHALLARTVADYQRTLTITQNQYNVGTSARSDVITALTQLKTTEAEMINTGVIRAQYEHAIAILIGRPPSDLTIPAGGLPASPPSVPVAVPSALLERRPDIAGAERRMQQQNALIGSAIAALYPDISLSGLFGFVGRNPLPISAASEIWSIAASATQTLADGGLHTAQVQAARATYDASVASYRQTVLTAFQQVEDQLSTLRVLGSQSKVQSEAVAAARQAVQINLNEYRAGTIAFTTVVTAQAILLGDEQTSLVLRQSRFTATVALIQALGGGWSADALPPLETLSAVDPAQIIEP